MQESEGQSKPESIFGGLDLVARRSLEQVDAAVAILETVRNGGLYVSGHLAAARRGLEVLRARTLPELGDLTSPSGTLAAEALLECDRIRSEILRESATIRREFGIRTYIERTLRYAVQAFGVASLIAFSVMSLKERSLNPLTWMQMRIAGARVEKATQGWGSLRQDQGVDSDRLVIGGEVRKSGFGTHSPSRIDLKTEREFRRFSGVCGLDDSTGKAGSIRCAIEADGKRLFESASLKGQQRFVAFDVPINGAKTLSLIVDEDDNGNTSDHAGWGDLRLD